MIGEKYRGETKYRPGPLPRARRQGGLSSLRGDLPAAGHCQSRCGPRSLRRLRPLHCLGFLDRRLLWSLATKRPLSLDISRCESCRPAVFAWLQQEVTACNDALARAGKKTIALVHVKPAPSQPKKPRKVERRSFFQALFHSTAEGLQEIAEAQIERSFRFDASAWLRAQQAEACELFCGLALRDGCTACGLCTVVCPTGAVVLERGEHAALHFAGASCTGCNLCALHCPQGALELVPHFAGQRDFPLDR